VIRQKFFHLALLLLVSVADAATVRLGTEVLAGRGFQELRGRRVILITNQTGNDSRGYATLDRLRRVPGIRLVAVMAPEHGLHGEYLAGREFPDSTDERTGLRVFSLYGPGPVRRPTPTMLQGVDVVVYDLQDIGVRSYTYISTLGLAMDACGEAGVEFMVLDRPNPLGGLRVEGPMVSDAFRTFVSRWDVPYVYGMTCGELARMINGERWITNRCRLTVIPLAGWRRSMVWKDTGLPWVATSPNVREPEAAMFLVATGVVGEVGGLSVGLGTERPFQLLGAPWLDSEGFCRELNRRRLPGLNFTPVRFTPERGAFKGRAVAGARIRITNPAESPLVAVNFHALDAVRTVSGRDLFAEAVHQGHSFTMFDKVTGSDATRKALQAGKRAALIVDGWKAGEENFRHRRVRYLLY